MKKQPLAVSTKTSRPPALAVYASLIALLTCSFLVGFLSPVAATPSPSITLDSPPDGSITVYRSTRTLTWTALRTDRAAEVSVNHYDVYLNGDQVAKVTDGSTKYKTNTLDPGTYEWYVRATDQKGNTYRSSTTRSFTVSNRTSIERGVILAAENFDKQTNGKKNRWETVSGDGAHGTALKASPDDGANESGGPDDIENRPRLDYRLNVPKAGAYYVWIRGKAPKKGRSVHVGLNGDPVKTGTSISRFESSFSWSNLRTLSGHHPRALIQVPSKGTHTLNVWMGTKDLVLDELLLTPHSLDTMSERAGWRTFSPDSGPRDRTFDVVVYGGTPGGITAAVTAARQGRSVLLLEETDHLGGIYVNGINHQEDPKKDPLTDLEEEFFGRRLGFYGAEGTPHDRVWAPHMAERTFVEMVKEEGISVRFGVRVKDVRKSNKRIDHLRLTDGSRVQGRIFIDASYFGDLMARAGVSYAVGRESQFAYGEPLAGIQKGTERPVKGTLLDEDGNLLDSVAGWADEYEKGEKSPKLMANNLRLTTTKIEGNRVPFPKPPGYDPSDYELLLRDLKRNRPEKLNKIIAIYHDAGVEGKSEFNNPNKPRFGFSTLNNGKQLVEADYETRDQMIRDEINFALGLIYFIQNHPDVPKTLQRNANLWGLAADEYADHGHIPYEIYVREARRMRGRYVMTQADLDRKNDRFKPDTVSVGFWWFDSHTVQRLAVDKNTYVLEGRFMGDVSRSYEIPYRSITPKRTECRNLLVPVQLSCSRVAMTSLRLEPTWMPLGVASGMAADLALTHQKPVQGIPVSTLQRRLKRRGHNIDYFQDEDDTLPTPFELVAPVGTDTVIKPRPTFRWSASSDPDTNIARYEVYIDGTFDRVVDGDQTSYTRSTPLSPGEHTWYVVAFNGRGLPRRSDAKPFRLQNTSSGETPSDQN